MAFKGPIKPGEVRNPTGANGQTPITDALRCLLTRKKGDALSDDEIETVAHEIAVEWAKKARSGELGAITSLTDRVEGKPTERAEITGKDGGDIGVLMKKHVNADDIEALRRFFAENPKKD